VPERPERSKLVLEGSPLLPLPVVTPPVPTPPLADVPRFIDLFPAPLVWCLFCWTPRSLCCCDALAANAPAELASTIAVIIKAFVLGCSCWTRGQQVGFRIVPLEQRAGVPITFRRASPSCRVRTWARALQLTMPVSVSITLRWIYFLHIVPLKLKG
jgi:hypothetical protein